MTLCLRKHHKGYAVVDRTTGDILSVGNREDTMKIVLTRYQRIWNAGFVAGRKPHGESRCRRTFVCPRCDWEYTEVQKGYPGSPTSTPECPACRREVGRTRMQHIPDQDLHCTF